MNPRRAGLLLSVVLAAAGFAAWSWPLPLHLATHTLAVEDVPFTADDTAAPMTGWELILANDQNLSLWGAVDNARALARGDFAGLMTQGQCWPMPRSTALGEHMFELGLLTLPWWTLTGQPVVAYNLSLLTALLVAASGMFLFLHRRTSSVPAAVVGAAAFAFAVPRLIDLPYHPAVIGTHWLPWVLWSFDRVLTGGGRAAAATFAAALLLASLTGSYPLMVLAIAGGAFGAATIVGRVRRGEQQYGALAWIVVAAAPAAAVTVAVVLAYARLQQEWALVPNSGTKFLVHVRDYLPGGTLSAGLAALLGLPLLAWRRDGRGQRAVPALLLVTASAAVVSTWLPLPGGDWSVYEALARRIPLLDSVRGPGKAGLAVVFGLQALGAIGWSRAMEKLAPRTAAALAALLIAVVFVEATPPGWARALLGSGATMKLREVAPARERVDVLAAAFREADDRRPVLDLPFGRMVKAPAALLDAAWHGHPTSACYNSLVPPTMREVYAMAARGHNRRGIEELAAAGFGFVIERPASPSRPLSATSFPEPARLVTFDAGVAVWALPPPVGRHSDATKLELTVRGGATRAPLFVPDPPHELDVEVTNRAAAMWAAPQPLRPLFADVEFFLADGSSALRTRARGVLPLALSAGATTTVVLAMPQAPPTGDYRATVRIEGFADAVVPASLHWQGAAN